VNWKLVLGLSAFGPLMGLASVMGWTRNAEWAFWIAIFLLCAVVVARGVPSRRFSHGFLVGCIGGALSPLVQATLFSTYAAHNPEVVDSLQQSFGSLAPRTFVFVATPLIGLVFGLLQGLLAWVMGKLVARSPSGS
jgi:hypothetical protein